MLLKVTDDYTRSEMFIYDLDCNSAFISHVTNLLSEVIVNHVVC